MGDAQKLSEVLCDSMATGQAIESRASLQRYSAERYRKNLLMMTAVDTVNTLFAQSGAGSTKGVGVGARLPAPVLAGLRDLRSVGLLGINSVSRIKSTIARFAMKSGN
jgi:2-polyprenyl-6-methoxyphenol hydroxylase-like FAD-dependent oxidoreductase